MVRTPRFVSNTGAPCECAKGHFHFSHHFASQSSKKRTAEEEVVPEAAKKQVCGGLFVFPRLASRACLAHRRQPVDDVAVPVYALAHPFHTMFYVRLTLLGRLRTVLRLRLALAKVTRC
jgi:hypothetical protein